MGRGYFTSGYGLNKRVRWISLGSLSKDESSYTSLIGQRDGNDKGWSWDGVRAFTAVPRSRGRITSIDVVSLV